jgi:error-prone DNA polymerase
VLSHVDGRLAAGTIAAIYRNGVHPTYRVVSHSGRAITATGNHPLLTPQGYRQLDDLAPGCEVALQWSDGDIFWDRIAAIDDAGEQETFDLTVEPHHNFVADGFVVHNSHAAAFARTTYETIWLRDRFPAAYYCALLNNQPMGFYAPTVLVEDAKRHGVEVLPVDVNRSRERCLPESDGAAMRLGFNYVRALGSGGVERIRMERERGEFRDVQDFCDRVCTPNPLEMAEAEPAVRAGNVGTSLNPPIPAPVKQEGVENLVAVGAFDWLGQPRRQLMWRVKEAYETAGQNRLVTPAAEELPLPEMTELERTSTDYQVLELTTGRHLIAYYRDRLEAEGVTDSRALKQARHNARVKVAGLVITRQAPGTAKRFRFFTLEDEWGHINLILRPDFFAKHRRVANQNQLLLFEGVVQNVDNVISVMATDVRALPPLDVAPASHDYR